MTTYSQPAIIWPEKYTPGETDNYASNEVIIKDLSVAEVWEYLMILKRGQPTTTMRKISWLATVAKPNSPQTPHLCSILLVSTFHQK